MSKNRVLKTSKPHLRRNPWHSAMPDAFRQSELESIRRDALSSEGKTFEQRIEMFIALMEAEGARDAHLTPEERERRRRIADQLDPRPEPWWRNIRKEALAEYEGRTSSDAGEKERKQLAQ